MKINYLNLFTVLSIISLVSCGDSEDPIVAEKDYRLEIESIANNVIVETYTELAEKADELLAVMAKFQLDPSSQNLEEAKQSWRETRAPWEKSEGFLFGPVDTEGIDPAIDSWPVNQVDLNNVLASDATLDVDFVQALDGTLKGFHTVEFLLWGGDGKKTVDQFTDREFKYLMATTAVLSIDTKTLISAWSAAQGNFVSNLLNAGNAGSIYISQKSVLEELANGILGIADEVGNGKINDPLEQEDLSLEESQFSDNSKEDFANNIRSIQNIYNGLNGMGLSNVVSENDVELDEKIKNEIQFAIESIESIPGTFTEAIPADSPSRVAAEDAQESVRVLQTTFESSLIPLISGL